MATSAAPVFEWRVVRIIGSAPRRELSLRTFQRLGAFPRRACPDMGDGVFDGQTCRPRNYYSEPGNPASTVVERPRAAARWSRSPPRPASRLRNGSATISGAKKIDDPPALHQRRRALAGRARPPGRQANTAGEMRKISAPAVEVHNRPRLRRSRPCSCTFDGETTRTVGMLPRGSREVAQVSTAGCLHDVWTRVDRRRQRVRSRRMAMPMVLPKHLHQILPMLHS